MKVVRTRVHFGDVVQLSKERSKDPEADGFDCFVGLEHIEPGELRIRRWGNIADGVTFTNVFRPGQVLFGKRRAYQRKVAVADFSGVCSGDIYVLEPKGKHLLPELLPFICQTDAFFEHAVGTSAGSLSPRTNWKSLADFEFALPPIEEQRRLCRALSACRALTEHMQILVDTTRVAQAATFEAMTSRAETPTVELGSLLQGSPKNGCSAPPASTDTGHWVLALSAISRWGYRPGELKPVEPTKSILQSRISSGDLVISRSNTRDLVGLPAVFSESRTDVSYPDTMMCLRFDADETDTVFMEFALRSRRCRQQIQSIAAGTSASMKKINGANVRKVLVPHPSLSFQREVVNCMSDFYDQINSAIVRLNHARQMMAELLKSAMNEGRASR